MKIEDICYVLEKAYQNNTIVESLINKNLLKLLRKNLYEYKKRKEK